MKILLDEQLPVKLKYRFDQTLLVFTVRDMKWLGVKDQALFLKIKDEGFDLFITNDQNIKLQVNSNKLYFSFLDLNFHSNRYEDLLSVMPFLNKELFELSQVILASQRDDNYIYIFSNFKFKIWNNVKYLE